MPVKSDGRSGKDHRSRRRFEAPAWPVRVQTKRDLVDMTCDLVNEFSPDLPAGTVIRQVVAAREALLAAGVRSGLTEAVRAMARVKLRDMHLVTVGEPVGT